MDPGQILIDRYRLMDRLGAGGMSVVWLAHDLVLGRDVAVKVLAGAAQADGFPRDGILTEAKAVARLSHPHVASVFDYGRVLDESGEFVPFVVMELLRGVSLAEVAADGPVPAGTAIRLCAQVAGALAAAHAEGLVHRDIKPGNVMVTASGAKVFDFGIAMPVGAIDEPGPGDPVLGTPAYLAPERIVGGAVSPASDVYALGVLLYRLLTHELPWPARTPSEIMIAHVDGEPAELPARDGVPPEVGELYRSCVAKDPADRPSARRLAVELAAAVGMAPALPDRDGVVPLAEGEAKSGIGGTGSVDPSTTAALHPAMVRPAAVVPAAPSRGRGWRLAPRSVGLAGLVVVALVLAVVFRTSFAGPGQAEAAPGVSLSAPPATAAVGTNQSGDVTPVSPTPAGAAASAAPGGSEVATVRPTPADDPPRTPAGPIQPPAAAPGQTFTSAGGSVVVACDGSRPRLVSWQSNKGYEAKPPKQGPGPGPATPAAMVFKAKGSEITMTATCPSGVPAVTVSEKR